VPAAPVIDIPPANTPATCAACQILKLNDATFGDDPLPEVTTK
jgi:hypothetical protein